MSELPAGLAPPLHIDEPPDWSSLVALLAVALLCLVWWLYRRRRAALAAAVPPPSPEAPPAPASGLAAAVLALLEDFERHRDPRRGCHDLAWLLRQHLGARRRQDLSTRTARELREVLGDTALGRAIESLANLQFRRRRPSRNDFTGICARVVKAAAAAGEER